MLEVAFMIWAGVAVVVTLLFLVSSKDLNKLSKVVDKPINLPVREAEMNQILSVLNMYIDLNRVLIKYRYFMAVVAFVAAAMLLYTAIYVFS
jgi:hypothetical protein